MCYYFGIYFYLSSNEGLLIINNTPVVVIIITTTMFIVREFTRFIRWMQTERRVAANPQTMPVNLSCESAEQWQQPSTSTVVIIIITHPISWYSFYHPMEGGRLSRLRHCSKGVQPMPKAVYRSGCHDKQNCQHHDSNVAPLTPQSDALTTWPLRPAPNFTVRHFHHMH